MHTPGKWYADHWRSDVTREIRIRRLADGGKPEEVLAIVPYSQDPVFALMDSANARVMAAGPELLEALRDMVSDHENLSTATVENARRAIAKATNPSADL